VKTSLYLHIPFCIRKCSYCDFTSFAEPAISPANYVELLLTELRLRSRSPEQHDVATLYFGGGTPSLLSSAQIGCLLDAIRNHYTVAQDAETTLEANPGTVTPASLEGYLAAGVNRLSIGMQSLDDRQLKILGRIHSAADARTAFKSARTAGFANISIDLMHGLPRQTLAAWQDTLQEAVTMKPEHISVYGLSIEEGTPFARLAEQGALQLPEEELAAAMLELTAAALSSAGYEHYEISNFALPGCRSRHNQVYWQRGNYLGFGAGAHSFLNAPGYGKRWENPATLAEYAATVGNKKVADRGVALTEKEAMAEFMFLGLRLLAGVDKEEFFRQFGRELEEAFPKVVGIFCERGLLQEQGSMLRLTSQGLLLANLVMQEFV